MKPGALIVDFGGVLTTPMQDSIAAFAESIGIELQDFVRVALVAYSGGEDSLVTKFETGTISEQDFSRELADRLLTQTGRNVEPDGLVARIFAGIRLEPGMLDLVSGVRAAGFKTALLSNSWGVEFYPRETLVELFDELVISGEVGIRKPDEAIFHLVCDRLGVPAGGCVFVDDHPGHLEGAHAIGMQTVLHRSVEETVAEVGGLFGLR